MKMKRGKAKNNPIEKSTLFQFKMTIIIHYDEHGVGTWKL
jgi:hypothetical protein